MSSCGGPIRRPAELRKAVPDAWKQMERIESNGCKFSGKAGLREALRTRQLCFAHAVYLDAVLFAVESGVGSRGSALVMEADGAQLHPDLDKSWNFAPENSDYRKMILETELAGDNKVKNSWIGCRPIPDGDLWFETAWKAYREGKIYQ